MTICVYVYAFENQKKKKKRRRHNDTQKPPNSVRVKQKKIEDVREESDCRCICN
jgi:hypothetical protein